jgi:hypothetical protein
MDEPGDPLDWQVRGLSTRARRVAFAAAQAILADVDDAGRIVPARRAFAERGVEAFDHAIGRSNPDVRRAFAILTIVLEWLPLFVIGAPSRMSRLPIAERVRYFERLEGSKVGLLAMLFVAFKVPIAIPAYEEPPELFETGFDREDTAARRRLPVAPSRARAAG